MKWFFRISKASRRLSSSLKLASPKLLKSPKLASPKNSPKTTVNTVVDSAGKGSNEACANDDENRRTSEPRPSQPKRPESAWNGEEEKESLDPTEDQLNSEVLASQSWQTTTDDNWPEPSSNLPGDGVFTSSHIFEDAVEEIEDDGEIEDSSEHNAVASLDLVSRKPKPEILDSYRYLNVLPAHLSEEVLDKIFDEIASWSELMHKGKPLPRLVAIQGDVDEVLGFEPLYRDSADYQPDMTPWTATVKLLRDIVSNAVEQPLNHAVICCYRHNEDHLSENSCPTLDLYNNSSIVKLSLGTPRTVLLRPKRFSSGERRPSPRPTAKIHLPHGSIFCLGPETNRTMTHEIKRISESSASHASVVGATSPSRSVPGSKRPSVYDGHVRVCITFRHVATFQTENGEVFGQGATCPTLGQLGLGLVLPEIREETIKNLRAIFFMENRNDDFDCSRYYGGGIDVVPCKYLASCLEDVPLLEMEEEVSVGVPLPLECEKENSPGPSVRDIVCHLERNAVSPLDTPSSQSKSGSKYQKEKNSNGESTLACVSRSLFVGKPPESLPSLAETDSETLCTGSHTQSPLSDRLIPVRLPRHNGVALLALDLQNDFLGDDPTFFFGKLGSPISPRREALLNRIGDLANEVRRMGGVVIFVKSQYGAWSSPQSYGRLGRPGGAHMGEVDCCGVSSAGADFHPEAEMMIVKQDVILIKEWYSAFMGTALDQQLERMKVGHVVVCGVTTNHSVAATVRSASNLGYNVILSSDGTAQIDEKSQKETESKLSEYYGTLLSPGESLAHVLVSDPCEGVVAESCEPGGDEILEAAMLIDSFSRLSGFGAGDSIIVPDFLEKSLAKELYESLLPKASGMDFQCEPNDLGHLPVYRSNSPRPWDRNFKADAFSGPMQGMKSAVESQTGHRLNWGQILCYRSGSESMDWNADNNLDMRVGSFIAAVALGGDRVLELKPKKAHSSLPSQRVVLEHNSLLLLGPETTRLFLHSMPPVETSSDPHIQVLFLDVATFLARKDAQLGVPELYGQGSEYGSLSELEEAAATRRIIEQLGMALAGVSALSTLTPVRGGSLSFSIICTVMATAATALWFQLERLKAWKEQERRLQQVYKDCFEEPLSIEEARIRVWQEGETKKKKRV